MNLKEGQTWLPPTNGPTPGCDSPLWSEALQTLIATTAQEVVLLKPDGTVAQHFAGGVPLYYSSYLSPSGRRLVTGTVWRDLETGQTVDFSGQHDFGKYEGGMRNPGWSSDEKRLFNCCFSYADVDSGQFTVLNFGRLELPGRDGPGPDAPRWVLGGTRVMIEFDLYEGGTAVIPLIDPAAQTYSDVRLLAGLGENTSCGAPRVAPDGEHIMVGCSAPSGSLNLLSSQTQPEAVTIEDLLGGPALGPLYLINLRTFITQTLPAGWGFVNWAPDSQFILLARNYNSETQSSECALLPITGGDPYPVSETLIRSPVWSPNGKHLAYLSDGGRALITLEPATHASRIVLLPQLSTSVIWSPQGDSLAVLAANGSLWWVPDPAIDRVEQLTPPLPSVRDVRWSPSGHRLAFVSGNEVYVVTVALAGP
jgi:WD40 repeat protein